ncbi:MAG: hypothetical protein ACPLKQ_01675 [Candidatus Bathyarchaeales archaeon]
MESENVSGENKKDSGGKSLKLDLSSKVWRTALILLAVLLTFAGPTYGVLIFINFLGIDYAVSMVTGFILFIVGFALIWYLIKNKAFS